MRVNHRRAQIRMAEEFLNGPDIRASLKKVRRKRMTQRVASRTLENPRFTHRRRERSLKGGLMIVMAPTYPAFRFDIDPLCRKNVLPSQFSIRIRVFDH